ncbi:ribosome assembly RNA-binding protein YhbY [Pseudomonadota bacterium]
MSLSEDQKRQLRKIGHTLKPTVMIGNNGLTDSVCNEIEHTIDHHELIKIKVNAGDREDRDKIINTLCDRTSAQLIQRIGHIALIFRRNDKNPKIHI